MSGQRTLRRLARSIGIALVVAGVLSGMRALDWFTQFRLRLDSILYLATDQPGDDVLLVAIDEASLNEIGPLPWSYSTYSDLLQQLEPASAVGVDVILDTEAADIAQLAGVAEDLGDVIFAGSSVESLRTPASADALYDLSGANLVMPNEQLQGASAGTGHVIVLREIDQTVRRVPLLIQTADGPLEALGLQLVRQHLRANELAPPPATFDGEQIIVDPALLTFKAGQGASVWINYTGGPGDFPRVSAVDVLSGSVSPETFEGKVVIVGKAGVLDETDLHNVPASADRMDGVEIQANAVDTLLRRRELVPQKEVADFTTIFAVALLVAVGVATLGVSLGALYTVVVVGLYVFVVAGLLLFDGQHVIPDLLFPTLGAVVTYGVDLLVRFNDERQRRLRLQMRFSKHVSPQLMELLAASDDPAIIQPIGQSREITILFTDIRGFTTISERFPPDDVVSTLNRHFDEMVGIVFRHSGYIDKYTGDGLMALYNAPLEQETFALSAVRTAAELIEAAQRLSREKGPIPEPFEYGIGIASGEVVVGNVGGADRLEYTAIGDEVNLSARLVGIAAPGQVLMDERTYQLVADKVEAKPITGIQVKGKAEELTVYELQRLKGEVVP